LALEDDNSNLLVEYDMILVPIENRAEQIAAAVAVLFVVPVVFVVEKEEEYLEECE